MKKTHTKLRIFYSIFFAALITFSACKEKEDFKDETFSSDELRVLRVSEVTNNGLNTLEQEERGISAYQLTLEMVFSHELSKEVLEDALSVSGSNDFTFSYDSSSSVVTLQFGTLAYETQYDLTIPAGSYGAKGETLVEDYSLTFFTSPFITPDVSLSTEMSDSEEGTQLRVTALLSEVTTEEVVVNLSFMGDAVATEDFTASATQITIPINETSASIDIDLVDDALVEGAETINVSIESVVNGNFNAEASPLALTIVDNDVLTDLMLKGVMAINWSTAPGGNSGKAVHLRAKADIPDLSVYAIGVANNGGGSDSIEYRLPAIAVSAGDDILLAREDASISTYFGTCTADFEQIIQTDAMNQNGDDAIELYSGTAVIQTFGDVNVDGTGMPWEYSGSWAYNFGDEWVYGGLDCANSATDNLSSDCVYPMCGNALQLQGVMSFETDPTNSGTTDRERAIHLRANRDIADLSIYGIGIANNGGGSDGREMDLPAVSVSEGDHILFVRDLDETSIQAYLGNCMSNFDLVAPDGGINFNGDDGVELYENLTVIEVYGDVVDDGTGLFWEYTGSWAFKEFGDTWTYGGVNCSEFSATNATSNCPYLFCE